MPPAARPPVFTVIRPILIGACCAIAGIGNVAVPATTAVPAMNVRRSNVLVMSILSVSDALFVAHEPVEHSIGTERAGRQRRRAPHRNALKRPAHACPPSFRDVESARFSRADFVQRALPWTP